MYDDLDGQTQVDVDRVDDIVQLDAEDVVEVEDTPPILETTPFHPSSIAPLSLDVVAPLSLHDRSTSFSWPPPEPARASSLPIYVVASLSVVAVLGLLVSFAVAETAPTPAAVVLPRTVEILTTKSASFASAPASLSAH